MRLSHDSSGMRGARRVLGRSGRGFRRTRVGRGFTLLETALATVIIGVGVLALVEAHQTFIQMNRWSSQAATATYLANEVREYMRGLPKHDPVSGLTLVGGNLYGWGPEVARGEVTVQDFNDLDDFDGPLGTGLEFSATGTPLMDDPTLPGPIDAAGNVIPEIRNDGTVATDANGNVLGLQGWTQRVFVEKLEPASMSSVVPRETVIAAAPGQRAVAVNEFPLRVTVEVYFQGPFDADRRLMTRLVWIVP